MFAGQCGKVFALGCAFEKSRESKEHKRDPRLGEFCHLQNPDVLNNDEDYVLACLLPELAYHRELARENITRAAKQYKARYDAQPGVRPLKFAIGDLVYAKTSRPSGQAVGKTAQSKTGPYRIVDKIGDVLFKLQDVQTNAIMTSLKHGDVLSFQPAEESSTLRQLQRDHGNVADEVVNRRLQDAADQEEVADEFPNDSVVEHLAENEAADELGRQELASQTIRKEGTRPKVLTVKTPDRNVDNIVAMPHITNKKQATKKVAKPASTSKERCVRSPSRTSTRATESPSKHMMTLRNTGSAKVNQQ